MGDIMGDQTKPPPSGGGFDTDFRDLREIRDDHNSGYRSERTAFTAHRAPNLRAVVQGLRR